MRKKYVRNKGISLLLVVALVLLNLLGIGGIKPVLAADDKRVTFLVYPTIVYNNEAFAVAISDTSTLDTANGEVAKFSLYNGSYMWGQVGSNYDTATGTWTWTTSGYNLIQTGVNTLRGANIKADIGTANLRLRGYKGTIGNSMYLQTIPVTAITDATQYGYITGTGTPGEIIAASNETGIIGTAQVVADNSFKIAVKNGDAITLARYGANGAKIADLGGSYTVTSGNTTTAIDSNLLIKRVAAQEVTVGGTQLTFSATELFSDKIAGAHVSITAGTASPSGAVVLTQAADGSTITLAADPTVSVKTTATVLITGTDDQGSPEAINKVALTINPPDILGPVITHTPVTTGDTTANLTFTATVTDNVSVAGVKLYYRTNGQIAYQSLDMTALGDVYSVDVPKANLKVGGLEYYIEATDGTNVITAPADKGTPYQVAISSTDSTAPEVTNLTPADGVYTDNLRTILSADYSDDGSGINPASVKLTFDGQDVTADAVVTADHISYTPTVDLTKTDHTVKLEVANNGTTPLTQTVNWGFTVGDFNEYFGGLHSHTNLSDGQGTPEEAFASARAAGADFMAITDHSNWFDNDKTTKANLGHPDTNGDGTGTLSTSWAKLQDVANANNDPGNFVAIGGFEMTWSGGPGHINTFNTPGFDTRTHTAMNLVAYYAQLARYLDSISQLNHPGTTFGTFDDFGHYTPEADAVIDLVEVGNGEGAVHSAGYFPSYQYYQMALDKGWHVAPSNNQDNHKGNWMAANDARTVILAPELTRDALYAAIRQKRVYATEDKDLQVTYHLNDAVMGSSLSDPSTLNFSVSFNDAETTDKISKVSVIANGGTVVASETPNSNSGTWNFTLDSNKYSFYYVRIDEADTDVAVTAPVWTGDVVPVGISNVVASQDPQIVNSPVDFTATVYNNGTSPVSNAKVEFFQDVIAPANKLGEQTGLTIAASGSTTAKLTWTPTVAATSTIYAQMTALVGGQEKTFSASTSFTSANPQDVTQIVIDGGHGNAYVTGYYAGKMLTLTALLKDKKFMPVMTANGHALTAEDLQYAKVLILSDPQSKPTALNYSADELKVIQDFVAAGGSLIIASRADYDEKGLADVTAHSAYQSNQVLDAISSNLRINDDEVIDDTSNGGQNYRLYFDDYTGSKYGLTDNIPLEETYSAYSGSSVVLKDGGDSSKVDWLVKGHDTTASLDSDLASDATAVAKGDVYSLAAEVLPNGSKVIVAGTAFFSDFETASTDNAYSNLQLTKNIIDWLTLLPPATVKTIAELRVDADADGVPDLIGQRFAVEGTVTAESKSAGTNNSFFDVIYVQDATGGLTIHNVTNRAIPLGIKVRITGIVGQYEGDTQIEVKNETKDLEILDSNPALVAPKVLSTGDSMLEANEGWLLKVQGTVTRIVTTGGDNSIYLDDGSGEAKIYVNGYIGDGTDNPDMLGKWDPEINVGDLVTAVGFASQDAAGHRIRVRNTAEIVKIIPVTPDAPNVSANDIDDIIVGINETMEYRIDGATQYTQYVPTNPPNLSGTHTVLVRVAASGINPAGPDTTLHFYASTSIVRGAFTAKQVGASVFVYKNGTQIFRTNSADNDGTLKDLFVVDGVPLVVVEHDAKGLQILKDADSGVINAVQVGTLKQVAKAIADKYSAVQNGFKIFVYNPAGKQIFRTTGAGDTGTLMGMFCVNGNPYVIVDHSNKGLIVLGDSKSNGVSALQVATITLQ